MDSWGCFHNLAIVNNAAINIGVRVSLWICAFVFWGKYPVVWLLDYRVVQFLTLEQSPYSFPQWSYRFVFPPTWYEGSFSFTSSPTHISCVFDFSHSDGCEVTFLSSFDFHFPDDEWCWLSFHVSVCHLCIFFGEISVLFILVFCLFLL